jgi:hypothetical protein
MPFLTRIFITYISLTIIEQLLIFKFSIYYEFEINIHFINA